MRLLAAIGLLVFAALLAPLPAAASLSNVTQYCGDRVCPTLSVGYQTQNAARRAGATRVKRARVAVHGGRHRKIAVRPSLALDANGAPVPGVRFLAHPVGCPQVLFCACGASVRLFGRSIRSLWPVAAWKRFPRGSASAGAVAIERRHSHLFVLESHVSGDDWVVSDFNSGGHRSRLHVRSIAGMLIVHPGAQVVGTLDAAGAL